MLKAGTNLASKTEEELITADAKSFEMGGKTVRVDQVNTVDLDEVFARESALRAAIEKQNQEEGYDLFLLMVTNILDSDTRLLVVGEPQAVVEKAFGKKLVDNKVDLPGVFLARSKSFRKCRQHSKTDYFNGEVPAFEEKRGLFALYFTYNHLNYFTKQLFFGFLSVKISLNTHYFLKSN